MTHVRFLSQDLIKKHGRGKGNMYRSYIPSVKYDQPLLSPRFVFFFNTGHDFLNALKLPSNNNLVQLLIILVIISAFVDKKKMYQEMII